MLTDDPRTARRLLVAAAILGVLGDPLLRNGPWGLGLLVWMVAFAFTTMVLLWQSGLKLSRESTLWLSVAILSAAGLSWHDADLLQLFDVLAMLTALVLLAMTTNAIPVRSLARARVRDLITAAFGTGLDVAFGVISQLQDAALHTMRRPSPDGKFRRISRALLITAPILFVFTLLLSRADPIFGSFFAFPDIDVGLLLSHILIAGFFAWVVAGWLRRALMTRSDATDAPINPITFTLSTTDVTLALGAMNVLFTAFVVVQIGWLFGGEALVLKTTGLSYAEYARRGFFELMFVAGLLLPVLLGAQALIPESDVRTLRLYRRLSLPLVVLLGAIMMSAGARMQLYVQYYGISTDRLYASAVMVWLVIVFVWFVGTVLRSRPRTFAAGMVGSGFVVLISLNCLNPDALVARANLARSAVVRTGATGMDLKYIASLGGDAVPMLVATLLAQPIPADSAAAGDRCAAIRTVLDHWTGEGRTAMSGSWTQWNIARSRALDSVQAHEAELHQLECPKVQNGVVKQPLKP